MSENAVRRRRWPGGFGYRIYVGEDVGKTAFLSVSCSRLFIHVGHVLLTRDQAASVRDRIDWWLKTTEEP